MIDDRESYVGEIKSWHRTALDVKYDSLCKEFEEIKFKNVRHAFTIAENSKEFSLNGCLKPKIFKSVFTSLKDCSSLIELRLARNNMASEGFRMLCAILPTLTHLRRLDISNNALTFRDIEALSNVTVPNLQDLSDINLSYNPLGDLSAPYIVKFLTGRLLERVNMQCCSLTMKFFERNETGWEKVLSDSNALKIMHLSDNDIEDNATLRTLFGTSACRCSLSWKD